MLDVLTYTTGVESNDTTFKSGFPYIQPPWSGAGPCGGEAVIYNQPVALDPTGTLDPPNNLTVNEDAFLLAPLTWMDNTTNELGYIIHRTVNGRTEIVDTLGVNATSYVDTVLLFEQPVDYVVSAYSAMGESMPSNVATYSQPAHVERLELDFVCYNPNTDSLTFKVENPNNRFLPYIYAQWWSSQRDSLLAIPGSSFFKTKNNPQDPNTFGNDNITGVWWADERLFPREPFRLVLNPALSKSCNSRRINPDEISPSAGAVFNGVLARKISEGQSERSFLEDAIKVSPNPFAEFVSINVGDVQGEGSFHHGPDPGSGKSPIWR